MPNSECKDATIAGEEVYFNPKCLESTFDDVCPNAWQQPPDAILLQIFSYLSPYELLLAGTVCKNWLRVSYDEFLWMDLVYQVFDINRCVSIAPNKVSWFCEYKRLYYHTPMLQSEVISKHTDQVLHVSFSHNGKLFATSSKDGTIKVWNSTCPASLKFSEDLRELTWKYTQFSQFNESDTLLLVSGVHFGSHSTSGEIAVFSLQDDDFQLQSRVINKPYDIFGCWYNDSYLLSGNLYWLGNLSSCSYISLNKAFQATESERESVTKNLFKFLNVNASSIRTIMVANCPSEPPVASPDGMCRHHREDLVAMSKNSLKRPVSHPSLESNVWKSQRIQIFEDERGYQLLEVDNYGPETGRGASIEYNEDYRTAETAISDANTDAQEMIKESETRDTGSNSQAELEDAGTQLSFSLAESYQQTREREERPGSLSSENVTLVDDVNDLEGNKSYKPCDNDETRGSNCDTTDSKITDTQDDPVCFRLSSEMSPPNVSNLPMPVEESGETSEAKHIGIHAETATGQKYLIFTTGLSTYTPHQIGIKKIDPETTHMIDTYALEMGPPMANRPDSPEPKPHYDKIDHLIDLHGHIIGMSLSPDHRYLYVNSRPWPKNYVIEEPLYPPPIAQEIDIHVIDLMTMKEVGTMLRSHKAYTPNDECFFIFLDVCDEYVASGAEDRNGYLWDRHYGICLTKFLHTDVVNSVAFNPHDPEMLVTVSDDKTIKIWRSRKRFKDVEPILKRDRSEENMGGEASSE